jgi:hypothetical protein
LTADHGLSCQLSLDAVQGTVLPAPTGILVSVQNTAAALAEKSQNVHYPAVYLYCERLTNSLKEKFATFSGKGRLIIEVRHSQDQIEGLEQKVEQYADAVCRVLDTARGSWQDGAYYTGGYEVTFSTVKHGGRNFLQTATIMFDVDVSK